MNMKKFTTIFLLVNIVLWMLTFGPEIFISKLEILIVILSVILLGSGGFVVYLIKKKKYKYLIFPVLTSIVNTVILIFSYVFKDGVL